MTNNRSPTSSMSPEAEGIQQLSSPVSSSSSITAMTTPHVSPTSSHLNASGMIPHSIPTSTSTTDITTSPATPTTAAAIHSKGDEDPMESLDPIALKRRQNTVAARRTRQRKLEHVRSLEAEVVALRGERDALKERCGVLEERVGFLKGMVVGGQQQRVGAGGVD